MGAHFVVLLAAAHVVLLRTELLHTDMHLMNKLNLRETAPLQAKHLVYVALQLLHRLPDELYFEIARHPFDAPDTLASITLSPPTLNIVLEKVKKLKKDKSVKKAAAAALDTKPPWKL